MTHQDRDIDIAIAALDAGDADELRRLIAADPELVRRRIQRTDPPYDGYFAHATLLHHVAGNPVRGEMPDNAPELARVLLEAVTVFTLPEAETDMLEMLAGSDDEILEAQPVAVHG